MISSSKLTGFRNLEIDARHELLVQTTGLEPTALDVLRPEQGLTLEQAAHMIENAAVAAGATADELRHVVSRMIKERAIRPDAAERLLAELRSATPTAEGEAISSPNSNPLANDYGYSA